jgi:hypothetical protein
MTRANRYFTSRNIWHIVRRCHKKDCRHGGYFELLNPTKKYRLINTKSLAVGGLGFTERFVESLGMEGRNRVIQLVDDACVV